MIKMVANERLYMGYGLSWLGRLTSNINPEGVDPYASGSSYLAAYMELGIYIGIGEKGDRMGTLYNQLVER